MDPETPEADAVEQAHPAELSDEDVPEQTRVPDDVDPADHVDQQWDVPSEDDRA